MQTVLNAGANSKKNGFQSNYFADQGITVVYKADLSLFLFCPQHINAVLLVSSQWKEKWTK